MNKYFFTLMVMLITLNAEALSADKTARLEKAIQKLETCAYYYKPKTGINKYQNLIDNDHVFKFLIYRIIVRHVLNQPKYLDDKFINEFKSNKNLNHKKSKYIENSCEKILKDPIMALNINGLISRKYLKQTETDLIKEFNNRSK